MIGQSAFILLLITVGTLAATPALARLGATSSHSTPDPGEVVIDDEFLGRKINDEYRLIDQDGRELRLKDLAGPPLMLVFSYFSCDGSCPLLYRTLADNLARIKGFKAGRDYNVLTVSFDKNDDMETLADFTAGLELAPALAHGFTTALLKDPGDIARLTGETGFKYYWSPIDKTFIHSSVVIFLSSELRVMRYLYLPGLKPRDLKLAIIESAAGTTRGSAAMDLSDLFLSACFSYNFAEGRYRLNYPLFIASGSFIIGVVSVVAAIVVFKPKKKKEGGDA